VKCRDDSLRLLYVIPSRDSKFSLAVSAATVVLAVSRHGLLLKKFNSVGLLDWAFQFVRPSHINALQGSTCIARI
jgi:hypothetical protein